jgi:hypothetical protein
MTYHKTWEHISRILFRQNFHNYEKSLLPSIELGITRFRAKLILFPVDSQLTTIIQVIHRALVNRENTDHNKERTIRGHVSKQCPNAQYGHQVFGFLNRRAKNKPCAKTEQYGTFPAKKLSGARQ